MRGRAMKGSRVVGRQKKKTRAEASFWRKKKPSNNFRRPPGEFDDFHRYNMHAASPPTTITPPHPPSRCILRSSPSPSPSVLLHERRWCQIQYFTARIGAMTWTIWPVSSLQHWTWCYDYTLHCRSDMPRMKGGEDWGVLNFLKNSWKSPALHPAPSS